jgi:hypothetical protein
MIHPDTEIRQVSHEIGCGVFAKKNIPKGTIIYIRDPLEITLNTQQVAALDADYREAIARYCYVDKHGNWILSWDHSKYVNHRCDCNALCTAYGFEIAVRDIQEGEEITDEYGLFNIAEEIAIDCGCVNCRTKLRPSDIDEYYPAWDARIFSAFQHIRTVQQPLWMFMDTETRNATQRCIQGDEAYRSVLELKRQFCEKKT